MKQAKSICRQVGCPVLIARPGYCVQHENVERGRFKGLRKAAGSRAFYGSRKWTLTAKAYRRANPLCADHKSRGMIIKGDLVDHVIERLTLIAKGLDPCSWEYLQTLCHSCHNRKLRARQHIHSPGELGDNVFI